MLNLVIIFTVVLSSFITSQHGSPLQARDIQDILGFLKRQKNDHVSKQKITVTSSDTSSDEDYNNNSVFGLLKNMEVIDLIENAKQEKEAHSDHKKRNQKRFNHPIYRNYEIDRHRDRHDEVELVQQVLEQLKQNKNTGHNKQQRHQRLTPNNLLGPVTREDGNRQEEMDGGLNEYSKVFVILDPHAIKKSQNKEALNNVVSRILSLSPSASEKAHSQRNKDLTYKGFKVKNNVLSRRYRRESRENSLEDDYKPKRLRSEHGGGGGTGGRTAIPYIRQRGDIYEREH